MYHVIIIIFIRIKRHILQAWNQSINEGFIYRGDYNIYIYITIIIIDHGTEPIIIIEERTIEAYPSTDVFEILDSRRESRGESGACRSRGRKAREKRPKIKVKSSSTGISPTKQTIKINN